MKMFRKDEGFTLVELMVVVLIIGILVAIAVPVFLSASANAEAKSCQANQRTIIGALNTYYANKQAAVAETVLDGSTSAATATAIDTALLPDYLKAAPKCAKADAPSYKGMVSAAGVPSVTADGYTGTTPAAVNGFYPAHQLP